MEAKFSEVVKILVDKGVAVTISDISLFCAMNNEAARIATALEIAEEYGWYIG